ncbi:hypothetical protein ACP275_13G041100 [Erythranthe tilingii]
MAKLRAANYTIQKERDEVDKLGESNTDVVKSQGSSDASFNTIQEQYWQIVELQKENDSLKKIVEDMELTLKATIDANQKITAEQHKEGNDNDMDFVDNPKPTRKHIAKTTPESFVVARRTRSKLNAPKPKDDLGLR